MNPSANASTAASPLAAGPAPCRARELQTTMTNESSARISQVVMWERAIGKPKCGGVLTGLLRVGRPAPPCALKSRRFLEIASDGRGNGVSDGALLLARTRYPEIGSNPQPAQ